jgi:hypothetical protein
VLEMSVYLKIVHQVITDCRMTAKNTLRLANAVTSIPKATVCFHLPTVKMARYLDTRQHRIEIRSPKNQWLWRARRRGAGRKRVFP